MKLDLPNTILNDTPADATPVEQNYSFIEQHINQHLINRDGSVAMVAQLHLVGDPVNPLDATSKGYVDALLPVGVMLPYCGPVAPAGKWALCNGASLATATYPKLFNVLGYRYGGSGGTFKVPNMAGRVPIGMDAAQTEFSATGKTGGSFTVPVPRHNHGSVTSGTDSASHNHNLDHNHASFNSGVDVGVHEHVINVRNNSTPGATGYVMAAAVTGTIGSAITDGENATHVHAVDIPAFAGTTSNQLSVHSHVVNIPDAGTASAELQPPFVVINYIVRID